MLRLIGRTAEGWLPSGGTGAWVNQLAELALTHGMSAFLLSADSADAIRQFAWEFAPRVRELVAARRQ